MCRAGGVLGGHRGRGLKECHRCAPCTAGPGRGEGSLCHVLIGLRWRIVSLGLAVSSVFERGGGA